jgi:hypothetical protein
MPHRFLTILTGRNLPEFEQPRSPEPSTINEKTLADFTRAIEKAKRLMEADDIELWCGERLVIRLSSCRSRPQ